MKKLLFCLLLTTSSISSMQFSWHNWIPTIIQTPFLAPTPLLSAPMQAIEQCDYLYFEANRTHTKPESANKYHSIACEKLRTINNAIDREERFQYTGINALYGAGLLYAFNKLLLMGKEFLESHALGRFLHSEDLEPLVSTAGSLKKFAIRLAALGASVLALKYAKNCYNLYVLNKQRIGILKILELTGTEDKQQATASQTPNR